MTTATMAAQAGQSDESLEQVKQRFALWRAGRKRGAHVTDTLWAAALGLVVRHGLMRVARELGVDADRFKKRLERGAVATAAGRDGKREVQFVELFAPPLAAPAGAGCVVDMRNARGGTMRVELANSDALTVLAGAFGVRGDSSHAAHAHPGGARTGPLLRRDRRPGGRVPATAGQRSLRWRPIRLRQPAPQRDQDPGL